MCLTVRLLRLVPACVLLALPLSSQENLRRLSPAQMQADLFQVTEALLSGHGGLYRYRSEEEIDELFGEALFGAEEERTALAFHRDLARLFAGVRCGHTRVRLSDGDRVAAFDALGLLPFELHIVGERAWIRRVLGESASLPLGAEVEAIDGIPFAAIRKRAFAGLYSDGLNETLKERELERNFSEHYALLVDDEERAGRTHRIKLAGQAEPVLVEGLSASDFAGLRTPRPRRPVIQTNWPTAGVAHLTVSTFDDPADGDADFPALLASAFREIEERGIENLVLDLRGNGGGNDLYGALLVSYLSPAPFRYFDRIEVTADYEGFGDVVERDGKRLVTAHPGLQEQAPSEPGFRGEVFFLIDGWTFSTAADVATVVHHNGWATFIGEETGGGYDGNTSGMSNRFPLEHSGIQASVPHWMYFTANAGHAFAGRGVPPAHPSRASIEDVLAGRDVQLAKALELAD